MWLYDFGRVCLEISKARNAFTFNDTGARNSSIIKVEMHVQNNVAELLNFCSEDSVF